MIVSIKNKLQHVFEDYQDKVLFAYLFGSVATGKADTLSDIDIAVFVANPKNFSFDDKLKLHSRCCRALKQDNIDLIVLE